MNSILARFSTAFVEARNLLPFLSEYTNPRDFLSRMVKKGELIRLKNGFYLIADRIKNTLVPFEQISNLLHGPSYISLEWALSHYGMIPEGVYMVTSVTTSKSKLFETPVGNFEYTYLSHARYAIGIDQSENHAGKYLIATPEKALADLVHFKSRHLKKKDLLIDLIEARRIEEEQLRGLNKKHLHEIADRYRSEAVFELSNAIGML